MSWELVWSYRALLAINGLLALRLCRGSRRYRWVAYALLAALALDLTRLDLLPVLLDRAVFAVFPALSAGLTLRVLTPRALPLALLPLVARLAGGPAAAEVTSVAVQLGAVAWVLRSGRTLWLPDRAVLLLAFGDAAALLGPWLAEPKRHWLLGVVQSIVVHLVLCYFQGLWLSAQTPRASASRSLPRHWRLLSR